MQKLLEHEAIENEHLSALFPKANFEHSEPVVIGVLEDCEHLLEVDFAEGAEIDGWSGHFELRLLVMKMCGLCDGEVVEVV